MHHTVAGRRPDQLGQGVYLVLVHAGVRRTGRPDQHVLLSGRRPNTHRWPDEPAVFDVGTPKAVEPQSNSHGARRHLRLRRLLAALLGLPGLSTWHCRNPEFGFSLSVLFSHN